MIIALLIFLIPIAIGTVVAAIVLPIALTSKKEKQDFGKWKYTEKLKTR